VEKSQDIVVKRKKCGNCKILRIKTANFWIFSLLPHFSRESCSGANIAMLFAEISGVKQVFR